MMLHIATDTLAWLFVIALYLTAKRRSKTIHLLRHVLIRACETCDKCAGHGWVATPGATLKCTRCGAWRGQLKASEHWLNG